MEKETAPGGCSADFGSMACIQADFRLISSSHKLSVVAKPISRANCLNQSCDFREVFASGLVFRFRIPAP